MLRCLTNLLNKTLNQHSNNNNENKASFFRSQSGFINCSNMRKSICFMTCASREEQMVVQRRQATTLLKEGFDVVFIVADDLKEEIVDGIRYVPIGFTTLGMSYLKRIVRFPRRMYSLAKAVNADIYQTETPDLIRVCIKLKKRKKKILYNMLEGHPYTFYYKVQMPMFIKHIIVWIMCMFMKIQLKKFDATFGATEEIVKYLNQWRIPNVFLLGNYPEVDFGFVLTKEDYLCRESRMIYYGHIPETSRQEIVFKALEHIPILKYQLAGKFLSAAYYEKLCSLPYWNRIEFINGFKREELKDILAKCTISNVARDLSMTKSSNGSMGILKIFESMEVALPLVLPKLPVYEKLVEEYNCGVLVDINDEKSIEEGVKYLVENKNQAYQMGQNGRRAVIEKYSWNHISKQYLSFIHKL